MAQISFRVEFVMQLYLGVRFVVDGSSCGSHASVSVTSVSDSLDVLSHLSSMGLRESILAVVVGWLTRLLSSGRRGAGCGCEYPGDGRGVISLVGRVVDVVVQIYDILGLAWVELHELLLGLRLGRLGASQDVGAMQLPRKVC